MANSRPLTGQASGIEPGLDAASEPVWLTAGEAADAANVTHGQVAAWVSARSLSARTGWRGGAEIQLVLLSDLELLVERVDLDRVRGSLAERGVFTGPRRVVLGGFTLDSEAEKSEAGAGGSADSDAGKKGGGVVIRDAHSVRAEDRVWATELDGEVRRLRQVIRTLRADQESLEQHLEQKPSPTPLAVPPLDEKVSTMSKGAASLGESRAKRLDEPDVEARRGISSGGLLAIACGVVMGMIGAAIVAPGAKTMASEKQAPLGGAVAQAAEAVTPEEAALATDALDAMELDAIEPETTEVTDAVAPIGESLQPDIPTATVNGAFTAAFSPSAIGPASAAQNSPAGPFFEYFLTDNIEAKPSGITQPQTDPDGQSFRTAAASQLMGPAMPEYLLDVAAEGPTPAGKLGAAVSSVMEASAQRVSSAVEANLDERMLVEPPPLRRRSRGVKPNPKGVPKRLQPPVALAELDRSLFARRSALLNDCAYTPFVTPPAGDGAASATATASATAAGPSGALVLGPCFGPTRTGQSGVIAVPGTHRVGSVSCCRHHAFVERMTAAALDEAARLGLRSEAEAALSEGVLPPLFRLRANRSATRFLREETRGWTSAGLDGIAGSSSAEDAIHEWSLTDKQPEGEGIRVELQSWIQPVVAFDPSHAGSPKDGLSRSQSGMQHFRMTLLVHAAPDGDVLESFEWLVD